MKNVIQAVAAIVIVATSIGNASAQRSTFYGPTGGYQGSASTFGNTTSFYGSTGGYLGSATTYGNSTVLYGSTGGYLGSVSRY